MSHLSFADFRAGTMRIVSARVELVYLQVFSNFSFLMNFDVFSQFSAVFELFSTVFNVLSVVFRLF